MTDQNRFILKGLLLFSAYLLSAKLGLSLSAVSGFATLVWLPTGLSFAALFIWGRRLWPAIALGAFAVNFWMGAPLAAAIFMASGNTLEAVAGVYFFRKFSSVDSGLESVREVGAFVFFGALISTLISATMGVGALYLTGVVSGETFASTWSAWWIGDVLSNLVVAPFIMIWARKSHFEINPPRRVEGIILGTLVLVLCLVIFGNLPTPEVHKYLRPQWIFILLIWATLRFGQKANVSLTLGLSVIATTCTIMGFGPYADQAVNVNLILLQMFTAAVALSGLFFGALGREKEHALRMRTDFISIASHELRTPLTGLHLSLNILKDHHEEDPSSIVTNAIKALDRQAGKLTTLVDSLLNVAQIENGKLILEKNETDISQLVQDVSLNLSELLERTSCSLKLEIQPQIKSVCSPYGIEQVLTNLMMNSMKYGAGKDVRITLLSLGNRIRLSVKDQGRGIPPEYHQKIFERYQRVDSSETQGLGLGLYISKLIIDAHKGSISVESSPGKGSTFTVEFPVA